MSSADLQNMNNPTPGLVYRWGFWGLCIGAIALMLVFVQIVGPSLEPKQSVGAQIGEIAGDMKRSAWRSFFGLPMDADQLVKPRIWDYLAIVAPVLGVLAIVLSVISRIKRENWHYTAYATGFGISAILFQFLWWLALMVAGIVLLVAIIQNLGDIFSF